MRKNNTYRPRNENNLYVLPVSYVAVDIETTGFKIDQCDIIEVGAVKVADEKIIDKFDMLVNIGYELDPSIVRLTGITDEMLQTAAPLSDVIEAFSEFIGDSILLAHNASFDMNFLRDAYVSTFDRPIVNGYVDTLRVARRAFPDMEHRGLADLCRVLGVINEHAHRALDDSIATAECYKYMRATVIKKFGGEDQYAQSFKRNGGDARVKARDIQATVNDIDDDNPLYGAKCVFTAKMVSMTRREAMQELKNVGGEPQDNITKKTNYLIVGDDGFQEPTKSKSQKIEKAKEYKKKGSQIEIMQEALFLKMLGI